MRHLRDNWMVLIFETSNVPQGSLHITIFGDGNILSQSPLKLEWVENSR